MTNKFKPYNRIVDRETTVALVANGMAPSQFDFGNGYSIEIPINDETEERVYMTTIKLIDEGKYERGGDKMQKANDRLQCAQDAHRLDIGNKKQP